MGAFGGEMKTTSLPRFSRTITNSSVAMQTETEGYSTLPLFPLSRPSQSTFLCLTWLQLQHSWFQISSTPAATFQLACSSKICFQSWILQEIEALQFFGRLLFMSLNQCRLFFLMLIASHGWIFLFRECLSLKNSRLFKFMKKQLTPCRCMLSNNDVYEKIYPRLLLNCPMIHKFSLKDFPPLVLGMLKPLLASCATFHQVIHSRKHWSTNLNYQFSRSISVTSNNF